MFGILRMNMFLVNGNLKESLYSDYCTYKFGMLVFNCIDGDFEVNITLCSSLVFLKSPFRFLKKIA